MPGEVLLARLKRAGYFLKPREGRPPVDSWLNLALLYRMTRNQQTGGVRALGRLALIDNYRSISRRLRATLESCASAEALTAAKRRTGFTLRCNRPRAYIVSSLSGGTGSGMFIDMAYLARELLTQIGHAQSEVIGLFLLPSENGSVQSLVARANAFAALTELNHFSTAGNGFQAYYADGEPALQSAMPPFSRSFVLPVLDCKSTLPDTMSPFAEFLYHHLLTPLGRAADTGRARAPDATGGGFRAGRAVVRNVPPFVATPNGARGCRATVLQTRSRGLDFEGRKADSRQGPRTLAGTGHSSAA